MLKCHNFLKNVCSFRKSVIFRVKSYTRKLSPGAVRRALHNAAKIWSEVSTLSIREVRDPNTADIVVSFQRWGFEAKTSRVLIATPSSQKRSFVTGS